MRNRTISMTLALVLVFLLFGGQVKSNAALVTTPSSIANVSYTYQDYVKFMDLSGAFRTGDTVTIPGAKLSAGDVLVDQTNQISLKILKVNADGSYVTAKPTMIDLFSEFKIPRQVIQPTAANITEFAVKGISVADYAAKLSTLPGSSGTQQIMSGDAPSASMKAIYDLFASRNAKIYEYNGKYSFQSFNFSGGASTVNLEMKGALGVSPGIVAEYSLFDGYEFGFVDAAQFIDLNVLIDAQIKQEVYLPVFAVTVPIAGLGNIRLGVYLVVNIDGNITLTVKAQEAVKATASVSGSTKWGIPTSFHVNTGSDQFFGAECDPMGYVKTGFYITPLVGLEILGVDVFDAQFRVGFYAYADIQETTMKYGVDFVVNAFVTILDDRTNLINLHIPIIERNKTFRAQDDVIFYFSRLCSYQDRINIAAVTKRPAGSAAANAEPFSDKLPFANRSLEILYYAAGNDPQGGANPNPTQTISATTDENGCVPLDLKAEGIDVQKGDSILIKAPGFIGQTDVINSVTPFGKEKLPGQSDFYGSSKLRGDFFEDTVAFQTLSGPDLTVLDVPNTDIQFNTQKRIYYEGPVTVYSTNKTTGTTEKATFTANRDATAYSLKKTGIYASVLNGNYDLKPNCELRWQINQSGFIYGTYEPTGVGGWETEHKIMVRRVVTDQLVPIEDYGGNFIGLQHNVTLQLIAVNKGGTKPYTASANLYVALGEVPADYVQGKLPIQDIGYAKFPANMRYPNHFEYYVDNPFPVLLYEPSGLPTLTLGSPASTPEGTSTQASYRWRWEEIKPDIPKTVTVTETTTIQSPTGAPTQVTRKVEKPNILYKKPLGMDISAFTNLKTAYTVTDPSAGVGSLNLGQDEPYNIYQMRHIVSGLSVQGVPMEDPPFSPPAPIYYDLDQLTPGTVNAFNIEFQLQQMMDSDRFVVNPLDESFAGGYRTVAAVSSNTAIPKPAVIRNAASLPAWAAGYIANVVNNGIMALDANGNFPVGLNTTRAEFCAAIVNALGLTSLDTVKTGFPFADVPGDPNLPQMQTAYQCGIINGVSATAFSPNAQITRQDAAALLIRAFSLRNTGLIPQNTAGTLGRFSDQKTVSGYAVAGLEQSVALGFFNGYSDGTLQPKKNITNEQTAKIIWELKLKAEKPGLQWG